MLSPSISDSEDLFHLGKPTLDPRCLALSRSTPQLNSVMATQTEVNAKESEAAREALKEKAQHLNMQRNLLRTKLDEKLNQLRDLCIAEAELTGVLPSEFPVIPGKPLPQIKKRVGTEFTLPPRFLEKDVTKTIDAIERLELEIEIQQQIATAAMKLAEDKSLSKFIRKKHRLDYLRQNEKLKQMKDTLSIYMEERGRTRVQYSMTTDDVDYKPAWKGDRNGNSDACYSTLPNPHRRRPITPQPQSSSSTNTSQSQYKIPQMLSDSVLPTLDNSSLSSFVSANQVKLTPQSSMAYRPNSSAFLQPIVGGRIPLNNQMLSSYERRKGSVSPSTVESSDLASSCSSLCSLQLSTCQDKDICSPYNPYPDDHQVMTPRIPNTEMIGIDPNDYSSYLRHTQKAYYSPNGKYGCGSLDRKKMVKKHSSKLSNQNTNLQIVELAELTPSKFGSKRESAADSQDSPYEFVDSCADKRRTQQHQQNRNYANLHSQNVPSFGKLQESSSESSGFLSGPSPAEENWKVCEGRRFPLADEKRFLPLPRRSGADGRRSSDDFYSELPSEMSDIHEYSESIRSMQQKHQELHGMKMMPSSSFSDNHSEQTVCRRRTRPTRAQGGSRTSPRKSQSNNNDCNEDAVDALFKHHLHQLQLGAYDFGKRRSSAGGTGDHRQSNRQSNCTTTSSSSSSSLASFTSKTSTSQPLRFVKVIPKKTDVGSSADRSPSSPSSYSRTPGPFEVSGCSTLV